MGETGFATFSSLALNLCSQDGYRTVLPQVVTDTVGASCTIKSNGFPILATTRLKFRALSALNLDSRPNKLYGRMAGRPETQRTQLPHRFPRRPVRSECRAKEFMG